MSGHAFDSKMQDRILSIASGFREESCKDNGDVQPRHCSCMHCVFVCVCMSGARSRTWGRFLRVFVDLAEQGGAVFLDVSSRSLTPNAGS